MKLESHVALTPRLLHVAPLTDVVLLLLTFFLIGSSVVQQSGIPVRRLPVSSLTLPNEPASLVVTLPGGTQPRVYYKGAMVSIEELPALLAAEKRHARQVVIRADELAAHGQVVRVADIALAQGFEVVFATSVPDPPSSAP